MKITDVGTIEDLVKALDKYKDILMVLASQTEPYPITLVDGAVEVLEKAKAENAGKIQTALEAIIDERIRVALEERK